MVNLQKKLLKFLEKMIYLFNNGPGRFGNHIYNLFYLTALSKKYKHRSWISKSNYLLKYFEVKKSIFTSNESIFKLYKVINQNTLNIPLKKEYNYVLTPPILGNNLFDYFNEEIGFSIRDKFFSKRLEKQRYNVAIHFRGTDFTTWDSNAILDTKYYIDCVKDVLNKNVKCLFILYTDDTSLKSYKEVNQFLKKNKIEFIHGNFNDPFIYDFAEISECNSIISSPSTFCIWASFLGVKNKIIYHSKSWIDYRTKNNDLFWINLIQKGKSIYGQLIIK